MISVHDGATSASRRNEHAVIADPTREVLRAFALSGTPVPVVGGRGRSVRVGDAVLKPPDGTAELVDGQAEIMAAVREDGFRVARPLRTTDGRWSHLGWTASLHVDGAEPDHRTEPRWMDILAAGRAFHAALAEVRRPSFLDRRTDVWAVGDRAAWHELDVEVVPELHPVHEALSRLVPGATADGAQLVHGDLTGNVLFAPGLPPAVIDFSPYWRPPAFAEAIVIGDAVLWHGAGRELLVRAGLATGAVARALVYRLVTTSERVRRAGQAPTDGEVADYERAAGLVVAC